MRPGGHLSLRTIPLAPAQEWACEPGRWQFMSVSSGDAYWLDAKPRSLATRELLVLPPHLGGTLRASQLSPVTLHYFSFDASILCGFFTTRERLLLANIHEPADKGPLFFLPTEQPAQMMAKIMAPSEGTHQVVCRAEALLLAVHVFSKQLPGAMDEPARTSPALDKFQEFISSMPDLEIIEHTPEELARMCGCTPRHFNRLFRAAYGESPRARQTEMRLVKGRALLETSDESIAEVATACGYKNTGLFISLFRRKFGASPREWRASVRTRGTA